MPSTSFLATAGALLLLCTAARAASSSDCAFEWEFPSEWASMPGDGTPQSERNGAWLKSYATPELAASSIEHSFVSEKLCATVPHVRNVSVQRVQHRLFWTRFERFRGHLKLFNDDDANERYLFHGTGACAVAEVLAGRDGLDPRYSDGKGFYGAGTYLAENAAYPIGGRFAHRLTGHGGARMQLLLVRAAVGTPQELDVQVNAKTRAMRMPGERSDIPGEYYDSVRAGPHRPLCSGPDDGGDGDDASIVFMVYRSEQMYVRVSLASGDHMPTPSNFQPPSHSFFATPFPLCVLLPPLRALLAKVPRLCRDV